MATVRTPRSTAALLLACALVAVTFAACAGSGGSGEPSKGSVKLTMSAWGGDVDKKVYEQRLALAHKKYPNITVQLQMAPGGEDYSQKISTAIAGGKGPDILELAEQTSAFASKNQILPLDEHIRESKLDLGATFGETTSKIFAHDGKQYAIPDRSGAMVLYYNKKLFDAAGVSYPSADWTWNDLLSAAQKLTVRQSGEVTQWGFATINWWPYWMTFMYQNGGRVLDDSGRPDIDSPQNVQAMQWYNDLAWKHKVSPTPRDFANYGQGVGPDQLFAQGKLAMEITGFWNIAAANSVKGLDWDISPLWHGRQPATSAFFNGLAISRTSKYPADAWKVIEFMASQEGQRPIIDNAEDAPANLQVQQSDAFLKPKWSSRTVNMGAFAESSDAIFVPPLTPQWNEMLKVCTDNIDLMMNNKVEPKKALATIQQRLEQVMSQGG
ncbi:ABC transporter substrate-binding protein [Actinopolymorpha pittospori]|uniref:Multiple sugar transport system substrate-binding protein n=1 Tax=Actinopolymorpha pittospori TaxID=648752 RepID=A0A927MPJ7_9ACTN|nr:sugar ABC transporter substrate-binding protein [Actinopolymorpha pittospori]MBE1603817.1 multiple sugar transport system substrate-binding protein [Actinopolymorpha pittospori]